VNSVAVAGGEFGFLIGQNRYSPQIGTDLHR
jgi:hypothetical protein